MDLTYTEEQTALKASAERYLTNNYTSDVRRRIEKSSEGFSRAVWTQFATLGWLGLPFAEAHGGSGGRIADVALLMEAFGRSLVAEPYVSTVVVAGGLIQAAGSTAQQSALIAGIIEGRHLFAFAHNDGSSATRARRVGAGWVLDGGKRHVLDAASASHLLVTARTGGDATEPKLGLFVVDPSAAGVAMRHYPTIDGRRAAEMKLTGVEVSADACLGGEIDQSAAIATALDRANAASMADIVGAMQVMLDATVDYSRTREQFGKPLSANQVLRHRMADMGVRCEEARSSALLAAIRADDGSTPAVRARAISGAKVKVSACARLVAEQAVQLHGGMGVTEELDIGAYFKRVMAFDAVYGTPAFHLARYRNAPSNA